MEPFNEAKYKGLMDGLEAVEIDLSVCKGIIDFRIDANTYKKEYVRAAIMLQSLNVKSIEDLMVSIQNFGAYSLCNLIEFTDAGIPFLMTQNVQHNYIDWSNLRHIDEKSHLILHKSHCKKEQILVTMAGEYLGRVAVYDKCFICSSNQAIAKITLKSGVSPYYISTFLTSRYGQTQIQRFKTITGQPNINMSLIKSLIVPLFSTQLYATIEDTVMLALQYRNKAVDQYKGAEALLLSALNYQPIVQTQGYSEKSFSTSFEATGRLDAEYYQPKYDQLFTTLAAFTTNSLGGSDGIADFRKSIEPGSESYGEEGIPFVRVSDITKFGISMPEIKLPIDIVEHPEALFPKKDSILFSKDGSVGIAYKMEEDAQFITSSALLQLTVKDTEKVLPDYLTLVLNSPVVQLQADRAASGAVIQHWKPSEIQRVIIPVLDMSEQKKISQMVQQSFSLRRQSEQLLDYAKEAVELAIEQGEDVAMAWLKDKVE